MRLVAGIRNYWETIRGFGRNARWFLLFTAITGASFGIFQLVFNLYLNSVGYSNEQIGLLNGIPAVVVLVLGLPAGLAADRLGYRQFLIAGAVMSGVSTLGLALATQLPALMVLTAVFGLAGTLGYVIGAPLLAEISRPEERLYLFSINSFLMTVASAAGNLAGGWVPEVMHRVLHVSANSPHALRIAFYLIAALNVLTLVPILALRVERRVASGSSSRGLRGVLEMDAGLFARLLLPQAIVGLGAGALITFLQLYFNQRFALSPGPTSVIFSISLVFTAVATLVAAPIAQRWGKVRTLVVSQLASIPFLLILAFSHSLPLAILAFYARATLMNMGWPIAAAFAMDLTRSSQRAALNSLEAMLGNLGRGGLGPPISGVLQREGGYQLAFSFTAVTYFIASLLYFVFFRTTERATATSQPVQEPETRSA